jgi:hypothetical protein
MPIKCVANRKNAGRTGRIPGELGKERRVGKERRKDLMISVLKKQVSSVQF